MREILDVYAVVNTYVDRVDSKTVVLVPHFRPKDLDVRAKHRISFGDQVHVNHISLRVSYVECICIVASFGVAVFVICRKQLSQRL